MKLAAERAVEMTGRSKTLRVSHRPWKSLRDSHIPTARLLLYILKTYFRKEPSSPPAPFPFRLILGLEKTEPDDSTRRYTRNRATVPVTRL